MPAIRQRVAAVSSMEPTISASIGGDDFPNQAAATDPVATITLSPSPHPSGSKASNFDVVPSTTTSAAC